MGGQPWSQKELNLIVKHYNKMPGIELQKKYFPTRTIYSIRKAASLLGLTTLSVWTKKELSFVKKYYGTIPIRELRNKYLSNRTYNAIRTARHKRCK